MTDPPIEYIYSGTVSIDIVRIMFMVALMLLLTMCALDIGNSYLQIFTKEEIYTIVGPEWGEFQVLVLIIDMHELDLQCEILC